MHTPASESPLYVPLYLYDFVISGVTLNLPAGLWGKTQFTPEEVAASRRVSSARIHVERSIGYLKRYKILRNKVPVKLLPKLSDMAFVCAQLVNLNAVHLREVDKYFMNMRAGAVTTSAPSAT